MRPKKPDTSGEGVLFRARLDHRPEVRASTPRCNPGRCRGWPGLLLVAKMIAQFRAKRPLNQCLLQLLEKPIRACDIFGLLVISKQLTQ